jgi:hypothetical protein
MNTLTRNQRARLRTAHLIQELGIVLYTACRAVAVWIAPAPEPEPIIEEPAAPSVLCIVKACSAVKQPDEIFYEGMCPTCAQGLFS